MRRRRRPMSPSVSGQPSARRSIRRSLRACAPGPTLKCATPARRRSSLAAKPGHDVAEARVDVEDFAGDARREVREQESRGVSHILRTDVAAHRRLLLHELQYLAEAADAGGGQRLDGTRRDAVDAYALRSEACG